MEFLVDYDIDILLAQETHLKTGDRFKLAVKEEEQPSLLRSDTITVKWPQQKRLT